MKRGEVLVDLRLVVCQLQDIAPCRSKITSGCLTGVKLEHLKVCSDVDRKVESVLLGILSWFCADQTGISSYLLQGLCPNGIMRFKFLAFIFQENQFLWSAVLDVVATNRAQLRSLAM